MLCASRLDVSLFLFASVMSLSARRWASLAFGHVVCIDSCLTREVTRLRRRACRWDELRPRVRNFMWPPAIFAGWLEGLLPHDCSVGSSLFPGTYSYGESCGLLSLQREF